MYSCTFKGYVEEVPFRVSDGSYYLTFKGYEFNIHLISIRDDTRDEENFLPLPKHFKIRTYCPGLYKEDDPYTKTDETLKQSLMPSIHVGDLIEFRGIAYKNSRNSDRSVVIPQQIKTAHEIKMDRHYIRIMPPIRKV